MGQKFTNAVDIHDGLFVGVIARCLHIVLAYLLAHHTGKLVVDGVTRTGGDDASLEGLSDEGHVADDVEQLVAGGLVFPHQRLVLDIAQFLGIVVLGTRLLTQLVENLLRCLLLIDDHGIVQVASLDEASPQQGLNLTHEHKGAGRGHLRVEMLHVVEGGKLTVEHLGIKGNHAGDGESLVGQEGDTCPCLVVAELHLLVDDIVVLGRILLFEAYTLDFLYIEDGTAIEDGKFGAVDLNQHIVHAQGIEGSHGVLHCTAAHIALGQHRATLGVHHVFCHRINDGHAREVDALNLVAMVLVCRIERDREAQAGVQSFSTKGETAVECILL